MAGRPLKFKTPEELQEKINEYFASCDSRTQKILKDGEFIEVSNPRPYTITGLALHLGTSRDILLNYQDRDEYSNTIKAAKLKIQNFAEESLWQPKIAQGVMFNLVNNWGWRDRREQALMGPDGEPLNNTGQIQLVFIKPEARPEIESPDVIEGEMKEISQPDSQTVQSHSKEE